MPDLKSESSEFHDASCVPLEACVDEMELLSVQLSLEEKAEKSWGRQQRFLGLPLAPRLENMRGTRRFMRKTAPKLAFHEAFRPLTHRCLLKKVDGEGKASR